MLSKCQADSQQAVDDLFQQRLIPFKLEALKVTDDESCLKLRVHFYDSRLDSVLVDVGKDISIRDQVRSAVLLRLSELMPSRSESDA